MYSHWTKEALIKVIERLWIDNNELAMQVEGLENENENLYDEIATITAKSKTTGDTATYEVIVKNQLPTELYHSFVINGVTTWNQKSFTFSVGENVSVDIGYNTRVTNNNVIAESSDESIISITNEGTNLTLHILKPGTCTIKITSVINPELVNEIKCTVVKAGAISRDNYLSVGKYLRKSVGHAAVFMAAQIFTYLTIFMFLYDKKWWFIALLSLLEGLFISGLSELIQYFVPSRTGSFLDVLINFSGVIVGALIAFGITLLINRRKKKKQ